MKTKNRIAVVGISCRYPDADTPLQLWENIMHGRRSFRQIPEKRLGRNYFSESLTSPDTIYSSTAALLKNYRFDRSLFNVSTINFQTADLAHWLALQMADEVMTNAGLINLMPEIKERTGVIIGNTLTGEQTRANLLRLRWPYVAATVSASLQQKNWEQENIEELLQVMEENFKRPFPAMEEDSLAGGLSNTIAGRICNYFDFKGGGFTIDGACSSSLLAIIKGCEAIANKDLLLSLAGGVDISLDPFELVGFSRAGALARKEMLVYDRDANGFWPGEGCGFVLLADYDFARENNLNILAVIKGWGISSDGKGGLTRPEVNGQYLALKRAYEKACYGIETVAYLEGHGTGTHAGDLAELSAILKLLPEKDLNRPVYISSIKANIGHTKAAAGIAGFIKALLVVQNKTIPAVTGNKNPHPIFQQQKNLKLPLTSFECDSETPLRAGISSMGFGGINAHITIEEHKNESIRNTGKAKMLYNYSQQDTELFLFAEQDILSLKKKLLLLVEKAGQLSRAEMTDLSCTMNRQLKNLPCRAAVEAAMPEILREKILYLLLIIEERNSLLDMEQGVYFSVYQKPLRVGFLFPGQGNNVFEHESLLTKRFPFIEHLTPPFLKSGFNKDQLLRTDVAQPAVTATSLTAISLLQKIGVNASVGLGHSVGELAAMAWAGMLGSEDVMRLAVFRGALMHGSEAVRGGMVNVTLSRHDPLLEHMIHETGVSVACINSPVQVVLSGSREAIESVINFCQQHHIPVTPLWVENAFHSSLMQGVKEKFDEYLSGTGFTNPNKKIFSTVSGNLINSKDEASILLSNQLIQPVLFYRTFSEAAGMADLWIETGVGSTLTNMVSGFSNATVCSVDLSGKTVSGLARIIAALYVNGNPVNHNLFFENRFFRPFNIDDEMTFIESPCGQVDDIRYAVKPSVHNSQDSIDRENNKKSPVPLTDISKVFKNALAEKLGLPAASFKNEDRMLNDFHLNSLFVGQFLTEFAAQYGLALTDTPMEYANASLAEVAEMFCKMNNGHSKEKAEQAQEQKAKEPDGIEAWVRGFEMEEIEVPLQVNKKEVVQEYSAGYITSGTIPEQLKIAQCDSESSLLLIFLYDDDESNIIKILLQSTLIIKGQLGLKTILYLQDKPVATAFAKSIFQELKGFNISVITIEKEFVSAENIINEKNAAIGFSEVKYKNGNRFIPFMKPVISKGASILPGKEDIILVTGGAKGITLECVRALGKNTDSLFILTGKSSATDAQVKENLASLLASNIRFKYYQADLGKNESVVELFKQLHQHKHNISGIIHAAGINRPKKATDLTEDDINNTLLPKLRGLQIIFGAAPIQQLKFCISFGSIIGKTGMGGNADYALANEWLDNEMNRYAAIYPQIKFLNIQWSVWGGTGMGQNLGVLESLRAKGIQPISLDSGIRFFKNLLNCPSPGNSIIVTGRYGKINTLKPKQQVILQPYRFAENVILHYPGTEIITECTLSPFTDPYLKDHMIEGKMLWPAVFGMEAMAQAVSCLNGIGSTAIEMKQIELLHPVIVENTKEKKIRIIAQQMEAGVFQVVVRDESSGFRKDHFRAVIHTQPDTAVAETMITDISSIIPLDVPNDIYGTILFHTGVFRQINTYAEIGPYRCIATAGGKPVTKYFSQLLPQQLLLGNPALNDAVMHTVQVCVPDKILLPVSVFHISFLKPLLSQQIIITAEEKSQSGDDYSYDITVTDQTGQLLQLWKSVVFKAMQKKITKELPLSLVQIVMQRRADSIAGSRGRFIVNFMPRCRKKGSLKRMDGKPIAENSFVSRSHSENITMLTEATEETACDMEKVVEKPVASWQLLFQNGKEQLAKDIQSATGEDFSSAATRVWSAKECMRKAGLDNGSPLLLAKVEKDNTVLLETGGCKIFTGKWNIQEQGLVVFAVLIKNRNEKEI